MAVLAPSEVVQSDHGHGLGTYSTGSFHKNRAWIMPSNSNLDLNENELDFL